MPHLSLWKKQCFSDLVVPYVPQKCRDNSGLGEWKEKCGCNKNSFRHRNFANANHGGVFLVKLFRDLTAKGSGLEGKSPKISGKSRLVKYYFIVWPDFFPIAKFSKWPRPMAFTHPPAITVKAISSWKTYGFSPERVVTVSMFLGAIIFFR